MLVLGFSFKPVSSIHVFCFVITTVDIHVFRVHPCEGDALIEGPRSKSQFESLTFIRERKQDDFNRPGSTVNKITIH